MKVTPEQRTELIRLYRSGGRKACQDLADECQVSFEAISKMVFREGYRCASYRAWTAAEVVIAERLLTIDAAPAEFIAQVGRSKAACIAKMQRREFATTRRYQEPIKQSVPIEVLEDRERRFRAPRSLTAILMGDPEPGRVRI